MNFTSLGLSINMNIIVAIVGLSEFVKNLDKNRKLKRWYTVVPFVLAAIVTLFTLKKFVWKEYFLNTFIYASISSFLYNTIKNMVLKGNGVTLFSPSTQTKTTKDTKKESEKKLNETHKQPI